MFLRSGFRINKLKKIVIVIFSCLMAFWFYCWTNSSLSVNGRPCQIQKLDPWDKSLQEFLVPPNPLVCSERQQIIYVNESGYLNINMTVTKMYGLNIATLNCVYQKMNRETGDQDVTFEPEVHFSFPVFVQSHTFRISCFNASKTLIYDYMHFNPCWETTVEQKTAIDRESEEKLSVIIFGIDSVSRSHALRNLPKSYKYLLEEFDAYDFEGYSKVGENTWPNLVPLLTGRSHRSFPLESHLRKHVDGMPLLWNEKVMSRFATYFAEDRPDISTFNFVKSGFKYQPTDFFFRPYTLGMHKFEPVIIDHLGKPSYDCYGVDNYFDIQVKYLQGFLTYTHGKRKFAYFWNNQVCHEAFTTLSRGDDAFLTFLRWLKQNNHAQNAVFVVLSDHGFRIGGASLTHVGRAENNKPWLMIHVPNILKKKYPWLHDNLSENSKRLTTHYDMYQTVLDLIHDKPFVKDNDRPVSKNVVRRNLFSLIPALRTCQDAGIEDKYCSCDEKLNISTTSELVQKIATSLVEGINTILSNHTNVCHTLRLHDVTEAFVTYSNSDEENLPNDLKKVQGKLSFLNRFLPKSAAEPDFTGRYYILFHTVPGFAFFDGTADYAKYSDEGGANFIKMIGEPSRLDRYGNQSACVQDSFLRLFCYCKDYTG